jgi:phenylpropionate dioxygenase-like ring-hydroxylating dioxygenase large terminal subunit
MNKAVVINNELADPVVVTNEAFTSEEYFKAEKEKLWPKIWQVVGRVEEIPAVGDYITYDIIDDTILITRSETDKISAFYNVCAHRGRRLADEPCGHTKQFRCQYHAWKYNLKGEVIHILDESDWNGAISKEQLKIPEVKVDTWGGWIFVNMDPNCIPLRQYLAPACDILDKFEFDKMRYRWRQWITMDCNWKVAMEAFMEPYHVEGTHPQLTKYGSYYAWSQALGAHGNDGFKERDPEMNMSENNTVIRVASGDARLATAELQEELWRTVNSSTTKTFVDAAQRLPTDLPEGTPASEVSAYWYKLAKQMDKDRGVIWPEMTADEMAEAGLAWSIFPNFSIQHGITFALHYRALPHPTDPNKCKFFVGVAERFPEGGEPKTEWVYAPNKEQWPLVLLQDFSNMVDVQKGMRSRGFRGALMNPIQERKVTNMHRQLQKYVGKGGLNTMDKWNK